ncbi:hypothetical protein WMF44_06530 [Sorangium sp. So ce426]
MKARDEDDDVIHQTKEQPIGEAPDERSSCLAVQNGAGRRRLDDRLHRRADLHEELLS